MNGVFGDTSYYGALLNPGDTWHERALEVSASLRVNIVLTDYIVLELGNALSHRTTRTKFTGLWKYFHDDPTIEVVYVSEALLREGLALYADRHDKDWSLTDCLSFRVMQLRGLREALTADHHFEQAGFKILLK